MIPMTFSAILTLFVGVPLFSMAVLALFYNFRSLHRPGRGKENIYECAECGHVYTFARHRPMDRCPRCGHLNDAVRT